jgi:hypothetical protein
MGSLTFRDFREAVLAAFPQLNELFEGNDELPHIQIGAFVGLTQRATGGADWDTYERCVHIAHTLFTRASPELEDALYVSFLEHLDFAGPRGPKAWSLLTPELQTAWRRITAYNDAILASRQKPRGRRA